MSGQLEDAAQKAWALAASADDALPDQQYERHLDSTIRLAQVWATLAGIDQRCRAQRVPAGAQYVLRCEYDRHDDGTMHQAAGVQW